MRFDDVVQAMAKQSGRPVAECRRAAEAFIEAVRLGIRQDGKVALSGFGSFEVHSGPARRARDFRTGATILAAPRRKVRFSAFKGMENGPEHPFAWDRS